MIDRAEEDAKAEAAYRHAAKLIERSRRTIAEDHGMDLPSLPPAIASLCTLIRNMPQDRAHRWIERLNVLLRDLHALDAEITARELMQGSVALGPVPDGASDRVWDAVHPDSEEEEQ